MKRKLTLFASTLLNETGINVSKKNTLNYKIWRFLVILLGYSLIAISTVMYSFSKTNDVEIIEKFINPVPHCALQVVITGHVCIVFYYRKKFGEMLRQMDNHLYMYPDEDLLDPEYDWYLKEENIIYIVITILCWQTMNLVVLCVPGIVELCRYRAIKTFLYPGWIPWPVDELVPQLGAFFLQIFAVACGVWLYWLVIMSFVLVLLEFLRQYKRLKKAVVSFKRRAKVITCGSRRSKRYLEENLRGNIVHCIRHHQNLRKNFHLFEAWFSLLFSWELAICTLTLAVGIYAMMQASSLSKVVNYLILVTFMMISLFAKCAVGDLFGELNNDISYVLFWDMNWYDLSKEQRQIFVIFHHMTCQPLNLFGCRIYGVTRNLYARIIRTTYSLFNVLKISLNK